MSYTATAMCSGKVIVMTGLGRLWVSAQAKRGWIKSSTSWATFQSKTAFPQLGQMATAGIPVTVTTTPFRRKTWVATPFCSTSVEHTEQFIAISSCVAYQLSTYAELE
jgi:hypothetical protein